MPLANSYYIKTTHKLFRAIALSTSQAMRYKSIVLPILILFLFAQRSTSQTTLSPPTIVSVTQPLCGESGGSVTLSGLPDNVVWEITQNPGDIKHHGTGTSTILTDISEGTYTFSVDEKKCPGTGEGLTGDYYNTRDLSGAIILTRTDTTVDFSWGNGTPDPSINTNVFSVHWSGQVLPCFTETYNFRTRSDDGVRLWVDGTLIIDNWTNHGPTYDIGNINLEAGKRYDIVMEYYEAYGGAVAELEWNHASDPTYVTVPKSQLFKDASSTEYIASGTSADVTINPPPMEIYSVSEGGSFCLADGGLIISLSDSETDVDYQLYLDGTPVGTPITGTGVSIDLPTENNAGTYTIIGAHQSNGCITPMDGSAVIEDAAPDSPTIGTITQPTCTKLTGEVTLNNLPLVWSIKQTPNDTTYYGTGNSTTITNLEVGTYNFTVSNDVSQTGLIGEYYNNITLTGDIAFTQTDATIDFDWVTGSPDAATLGNDYYSIRWSGKVKPLYSETYTFYTRSDDGIQLWVDGVGLVQKWIDQGATTHSGTIALQAGVAYDIVIEYYEKTGNAVAELEWSSASQTQEIIPASQLLPITGDVVSCYSEASDDVVISSEHVTPVIPDSITVDQSIIDATYTDSITLRAHGGLGWTLKWFSGSCNGTAVGTDTLLRIPAPSSATDYYALWETSCGQTACLSLGVAVLKTSTDSITSIGETSAKLCGSISLAEDIVEYGFYYSTNDTIALLSEGNALKKTVYNDVSFSTPVANFSSTITSLTNRSAYYCRSYMKDVNDNYFYGKVIRFLSEKRDFSLALDGNDDALIVDKASTTNTLNDWGASDNTFSVEFWVKKGSSSTTKQVIYANQDATGGYEISLENDIIKLINPASEVAQSVAKIKNEDWHYVAITYNAGNAIIYINDSASTSQSISITLPKDTNAFIGANYDGTNLTDEFNGNLDAMRFWNIALTASQIKELAYDEIKEGTTPNSVISIGSENVISSVNWSKLTANFGFNVMSTQEETQTMPANLDYTSQDQMHKCPFFHNNARLSADKPSFNLIAIGEAHPSPYLPRTNWLTNSTTTNWTDTANWSGNVYPGQGATKANYPDVTLTDLANDSTYCLYTIINTATNKPLIDATPTELQILIDREENTGTYLVVDPADLTIMKGVYPELFEQRANSDSGSIIINEGAVEVFNN